MKPEDFITEDMEADIHDYDVRGDGTIVAILEICSDNYEGDITLTKTELEAAIAFAKQEGMDEEIIAAFDAGVDLIQRAEAQDDPEDPDLNSLLFGDNPQEPKP